MKILVISLLRLGDIAMTAPALRGLKKKYPAAQLHVLINAQFAPMGDLLCDIDRVHLFPRGFLQESLTRADRPLLEAVNHLEAFVTKLRDENFDWVINLTHNRLSGYLCALIRGREMTGLSLSLEGVASFGSSWFRHLNDRAETLGQDNFHYSDIFLYGCGIDTAHQSFRLKTSAVAEEEANQILAGAQRPIFIQPLTSDEKKNWPFTKWTSLLVELQSRLGPAPVFLLGAPFEREELLSLRELCRAQGVNVNLAICSLAGAFSLLQRGRLLITGDTAIKHLASATSCQVIEMSIGSSDWRRTGVYKAGSIIIYPSTSCHPCPHSSDCSRPLRDCANEVDVATVSSVVLGVLANDLSSIRASGTVQVLRTGFAASGYWQALPLASKLSKDEIRLRLHKTTLKMLLKGEHLRRIGDFGTEALCFRRSLKDEFPHIGPKTWSEVFDDLNREITIREKEARSATEKLAQMVQQTRSAPIVDLGQMRQFKQKADEAFHLIQIQKKLLRSIQEASVEAL